MEIFSKILSSILTTFYQAFFYAVVLSMAVMFIYKLYPNLKTALSDWFKWFKSDAKFRCVFFLVLYCVMILFRTLLNRNMWENPVSNVIGVWGLYTKEGKLTTEAIENVLMFIPFTVILLHTYNKTAELSKRPKMAILYGTKTAFVFSVSIEFIQLFLRLGTFQLSDLFHNTLGGFIGSFLYYLYLKLKRWLN